MPCQFGIHSDPSQRKKFSDTIPDDPNWLPPGKPNRMNDKGVKRFARGYMSFAGGGNKPSRTKQLFVALKANGPLAGGSPWEVPWGELVGDYSYETLDQIYTGYGEDGPPQGRLSKEGASDAVQQQWPLLDYIRQCTLVDERVVEPLTTTAETE